MKKYLVAIKMEGGTEIFHFKSEKARSEFIKDLLSFVNSCDNCIHSTEERFKEYKHPNHPKRLSWDCGYTVCDDWEEYNEPK